MKAKLLIVGLLAMTQLATARYSAPAKVVDIYAYAGNHAVIKLNINVADSGCTYKNVMVIPYYTSTNKGMYSSILSAAVANKSIKVGYTPGNCSNMWGTRSLNKIYSVILSSN